MSEERPNFFAGPYLDRRAELREEVGWLEAARADPDTRYLLGRGRAQLVYGGEAPGIAFLDRDAPLVSGASAADHVLLGWYRGTRVVLVDLPPRRPWSCRQGRASRNCGRSHRSWMREQAGLLAYARALSFWRARPRYCGACGAQTTATHAGHCMVCTDPACARSTSRASTRPSSCW